MKQYILTGLATAALTATVTGLVSSSQASPDREVGASETKVSLNQTALPSPQLPQATSANTVKVGEHQAQELTGGNEESFARIVTQTRSGRNAATLYVQNKPLITFLGSQSVAGNGVKIASTAKEGFVSGKPSTGTSASNSQDPVWRAATVAAKLNQLHQAGVDAKTVNVKWSPQRRSYLIQAKNEHLLEVSDKTILAASSNQSSAKNALQITNQLREQLGGAPPLSSIPGQPTAKAKKQVLALGPVRFQIKGMASWYGPGFDGAQTASGERFNQYAMTAAHRHLPFGTQVRVTNLNNGRSVVVRINDRGPFSGGRVLDLSRGAAQVLGVIGSGVAPVRIDVLN